MRHIPVQASNTLKSEPNAFSRQVQARTGLLYLREEEIRIVQDCLILAMRDLNAAPDAILDELGFGRAHHRALHWIGRMPDLKVGELLKVLGVAKQSLARVLRPLVQQGYVQQDRGKIDGRRRLLTLTEKGTVLERKLFECQREHLAAAYREAGGEAIDGFQRVLRGIASEQARKYLDW
jgi:DNA-binding MarR family transcriptional regulator